MSGIDRKTETSAQNDEITRRHGDTAQQPLRRFGEDWPQQVVGCALDDNRCLAAHQPDNSPARQFP